MSYPASQRFTNYQTIDYYDVRTLRYTLWYCITFLCEKICLFYNTKTSILGTEKQLSYYILETVPTLLIFSSSRSSPKSVGFRTCFSTIRSLSWISICRGGPYRHSLNWDGSIMPTSKQDQDIFLNYDSREYPCKVTTHV